MWNWIKKVIVGNPIDLLMKLIPNPLVAMLVRKALEIATAQALPFVVKMGDMIVAGTFWQQDDKIWQQTKEQYPSLFTEPHTAAETKLVALLLVRTQLLALVGGLNTAGAGIAAETAVSLAAAENRITTASMPPVISE